MIHNQSQFRAMKVGKIVRATGLFALLLASGGAGAVMAQTGPGNDNGPSVEVDGQPVTAPDTTSNDPSSTAGVRGDAAPASPLPPLIEAPDGLMSNSFATTDHAAPNVATPESAMTPVVIELFTSQGCSSCPTADMLLAELADRPDVLPLAYHVDYWDYLGWADSFAKPEFTERQKKYAQAAGERAIYTPQMIVEGADTAPSMGPVQLTSMIEMDQVGPAMLNVVSAVDNGQRVFKLQPLSDLGGRSIVFMVYYAPERRVEIAAGENRGKTMVYHNIVLAIEDLAEWDGLSPLRLRVSDGDTSDFPEDTRHAIIVQRLLGRAGLPGPILTAIRLD